MLRNLTLALAFSCFAIYFFQSSDASAQEQLKRAPYAEGQFWLFKLKSWDWQVSSSTRLLSGFYKILHTQGQFKYFYVDEKGNEESIAVHPNLRWLLGQRPRDFRFPLSVDKKWRYQYPWRVILPEGATPQNLTRTVEIEVVGVEEVDTPAGTVEAFKLVKEDWYVARHRVVTTYYWNRRIRSVVKSLYDESVDTHGTGGKAEFELIKYGVSGQSPAVVGREEKLTAESSQ